jgi:hypothetical protein
MKVKEFTSLTEVQPTATENSANNLPNFEESAESVNESDNEFETTKGKKPLSPEVIQQNMELYTEFVGIDLSKIHELGLRPITQYQLISELPVVVGKLLNHPEIKITKDDEVIQSVSDNQQYYTQQLVVIMQLLNLILPADKIKGNPELFGKLLQDTKLGKVISIWNNTKLDAETTDAVDTQPAPEKQIEQVQPQVSPLSSLDSFI